MKNSHQLVEIPNSELLPSLVTDLQETLWSEQELLKAVQTFQNSGVRKDLRQALRRLDADIEHCLGKVRAVFKMLGLAPTSKESKPMLALLQEAEQALQTFDKSALLDVAIIQVLRKILGYRKTCYQALVIYSALTGYEAADFTLVQAGREAEMIDLTLEAMAMLYMVD